MILAIDAGNSRTKWGIFDVAGELQTDGVCLNDQFKADDAPLVWRSCNSAVVSNVAGAEMAAKLVAALQHLAIPATWVQSSLHACGVSNSYEQPEQLGTDRWAAIIAVWHLYHAPCLVINAGTALTIDALALDAENKSGIFLGGMIVPGFRLMQDSLYQRTAGIGEYPGNLQIFPRNTGDAVYSGAVSAMAGAVKLMLKNLQHHASAQQQALPRCIITGGDAELLAQVLNDDTGFAFDPSHGQIIIADNLVLQGLLLLEREAS
ncbi:MAG TPA: type III pantothenate kinase [Methylophilaceae bacterium]|nr:type III pantothenate kinase [Methylophilaceae bacterium]